VTEVSSIFQRNISSGKAGKKALSWFWVSTSEATLRLLRLQVNRPMGRRLSPISPNGRRTPLKSGQEVKKCEG